MGAACSNPSSKNKKAEDMLITTEANRNHQPSISKLINEQLLNEDLVSFDSELFYCWVTDVKKEKEKEKNSQDTCTFNLHIIDIDGIKCCYTLNTNYNRIKQIYSIAYNNKDQYFPTNLFPRNNTISNKLSQKLSKMEKYMLVPEIQWLNITFISNHDITIVCDLLITLFNSMLFVQKDYIFTTLVIDPKIKNLLQYVSKRRHDALINRAKNSGTPLRKHKQFNDLRFHTVSLVKRPNDVNVYNSNHWAIKFQGEHYLFSLDCFQAGVYCQTLKNDAWGQRIFWYSWIGQTEFIRNWSERMNIVIDLIETLPTSTIMYKNKNTFLDEIYAVIKTDNELAMLQQYINDNEYDTDAVKQDLTDFNCNETKQPISSISGTSNLCNDTKAYACIDLIRNCIIDAGYITFHEIICLVNEWKTHFPKYHPFENNCQHFARDIISIFKPIAAKQLTDEFKNIYSSRNIDILTKEYQRIENISDILRKRLKDDYEIRFWLTNVVTLPKCYEMFIENGFDNLLHIQNITIDILRNMRINYVHQQQIMHYVVELQTNNETNCNEIKIEENDVKNWNHEEFMKWVLNVENGRFKRYKNIFETQQICGLNLPEIDRNELKEMGITIVLDRKKLYCLITQLLQN